MDKRSDFLSGFKCAQPNKALIHFTAPGKGAEPALTKGAEEEVYSSTGRGQVNGAPTAMEKVMAAAAWATTSTTNTAFPAPSSSTLRPMSD